MNGYKSIATNGTSEYDEKGSRFIGFAFPITSEAEIADFLKAIRTEHYSARHAVYAFRLRNGKEMMSDDGEPSGTGGKPILEFLRARELEDCLVVVVRYFGGVLLGTGGLFHAYGTAGKDAVENGEIVSYVNYLACEVTTDYSLQGKVDYLLEKAEARNVTKEYSADVKIQFAILPDRMEELSIALTTLSGGKMNIIHKNEIFLPKLQNNA